MSNEYYECFNIFLTTRITFRSNYENHQITIFNIITMNIFRLSTFDSNKIITRVLIQFDFKY